MAKMEVPNVTEQRTRPSGEGLKYFDTPSWDDSGLLRGLNQLAQGVSIMAQRNDVEKDQAQRFGALNSLSEFQISIADSLRAQKEMTTPGDLNFRERAEQTYKNYEDRFIASLPPEYQPEFRYRAQQIKVGYIADAEAFNGIQLRKYGENGIDTAQTAAKVAINTDEDSTDDQLMKMNELIDSMPGQSAMEKQQLKLENERQLRGLQYGKMYQKGKTEGPGPGHIVPGSQADIIARTAKEIGADPTELALVMMYETIGKLSPSIRGGKKNRYIGLIQFGPNEQKMYGAHQGQTFEEQMGAVKRYLVDRGFKPGMGIEDLYSTINAGRPGRYKASDRAGANVLTHVADMKKIYGKKAEALMGGKLVMDALDDDPRFALVPYEDRIKLRQDGDTAIQAQYSAQQAQIQADHDMMMNQLALDIHDGKAGRLEIDQMREAGIIDDIDDVQKLEGILKAREDDIDLVARGREKLMTGSIWDPTSDEDKKSLNAMVKADDGINKVQSGDEEYVNGNLLPMIQKTNDVPTIISGLLTGQMRSNDPKKSLYALDVLGRIQDKSPAAFNQRFTEDVVSDVDWFRTMRSISSEEDLLRQLRGGWTTEERNARKAYKEEAKQILSQPKNPNYVDFSAVINDMAPWFGAAPQLPGIFWAKRAAEADFNAIYTDEFTKYAGNAQFAKDAAIKRWQRYWTVFDMGAGPTLTKYAPPTMGYQKMMDSYDWVQEVAREELGLAPDAKIQIIGDETTKSDFLRWQAGAPQQVEQAKPLTSLLPGVLQPVAKSALTIVSPTPRLPSYRITVYDENRNQWVVPNKPDGTPVQRMWFKPPPELKALEEDEFLMKQDQLEAQDYYNRVYLPAEIMNVEAGLPIPEEIVKRMEELTSRYEESGRIFDENQAAYRKAKQLRREGKQPTGQRIEKGTSPAPANLFRPRAIGR